jgi:hypothetical protein
VVSGSYIDRERSKWGADRNQKPKWYRIEESKNNNDLLRGGYAVLVRDSFFFLFLLSLSCGFF